MLCLQLILASRPRGREAFYNAYRDALSKVFEDDAVF